ncbi:MAG: hypothetical protein V3T04_04375 [Dehalococcoidia bacterium]
MFRVWKWHPGFTWQWHWLALVIGSKTDTEVIQPALDMPGRLSVACLGIGQSGARNGVLAAAQILGTEHKEIRETYPKYK